ncbi:uncharacterized protein LAESUDRAFT_721787 [Laetiporus sulphureus 93-53]|uniref:Uncharacterized protein n=1 Tax=Laetiporus sulphureus 93-53 TaxID=1314785 RepID=A0A165GJ31_9APHY|nr:uncharacterized protein LAESUDRAFT_721787 [Laetiporus sulphureus 93-53]KZT10420.1 hypothetical protein LAESUDRAFT_721787 [Laetiporus sulphureus 93-53]
MTQLGSGPVSFAGVGAGTTPMASGYDRLRDGNLNMSVDPSNLLDSAEAFSRVNDLADLALGAGAYGLPYTASPAHSGESASDEVGMGAVPMSREGSREDDALIRRASSSLDARETSGYTSGSGSGSRRNSAPSPMLFRSASALAMPIDPPLRSPARSQTASGVLEPAAWLSGRGVQHSASPNANSQLATSHSTPVLANTHPADPFRDPVQANTHPADPFCDSYAMDSGGGSGSSDLDHAHVSGSSHGHSGGSAFAHGAGGSSNDHGQENGRRSPGPSSLLPTQQGIPPTAFRYGHGTENAYDYDDDGSSVGANGKRRRKSFLGMGMWKPRRGARPGSGDSSQSYAYGSARQPTTPGAGAAVNNYGTMGRTPSSVSAGLAIYANANANNARTLGRVSGLVREQTPTLPPGSLPFLARPYVPPKTITSPPTGTGMSSSDSPFAADPVNVNFNVDSSPSGGESSVSHTHSYSHGKPWAGLFGAPDLPSPALTEGSGIVAREGLLDPRLGMGVLGAAGMESQGALSFRDEVDYSRPIGGLVNNQQHSQTTFQTSHYESDADVENDDAGSELAIPSTVHSS